MIRLYLIELYVNIVRPAAKAVGAVVIFVLLLTACQHAPEKTKKHASTSAVGSDSCAVEEEKEALDVRALQSHLMVAALSCHMQDQYNAFVKKFNSQFSRRGEDIREYFTRVYGKKGGEARLNSTITKMANQASQRSLNVSEGTFCDSAEKLFREVMGTEPKAIFHLAADQKFASLHGVKGCNSDVAIR